MQCPFCKEEILESAIKCKHCGSMLSGQGNTSTASTPVAGGKAAYTDYSQVPWYRKNWFVILCAFIFAPALFFIAASGDIYYVRKGQIRTYSKAAKIIVGIIGIVFFINVLRAL